MVCITWVCVASLLRHQYSTPSQRRLARVLLILFCLTSHGPCSSYHQPIIIIHPSSHLSRTYRLAPRVPPAPISSVLTRRWDIATAQVSRAQRKRICIVASSVSRLGCSNQQATIIALAKQQRSQQQRTRHHCHTLRRLTSIQPCAGRRSANQVMGLPALENRLARLWTVSHRNDWQRMGKVDLSLLEWTTRRVSRAAGLDRAVAVPRFEWRGRGQGRWS